VLYELHVGAFSALGTFEGVIPHLDELKDLGISFGMFGMGLEWGRLEWRECGNGVGPQEVSGMS
jgi:hypothetical protein